MVDIPQYKLESLAFRESFPDTIKELRKRGKYTQAELADKLGLSQQSIQQWENGKTLPSIDLIPSIARALRVPIAEFCKRIFTI